MTTPLRTLIALSMLALAMLLSGCAGFPISFGPDTGAPAPTAVPAAVSYTAETKDGQTVLTIDNVAYTADGFTMTAGSSYDVYRDTTSLYILVGTTKHTLTRATAAPAPTAAPTGSPVPTAAPDMAPTAAPSSDDQFSAESRGDILVLVINDIAYQLNSATMVLSEGDTYTVRMIDGSPYVLLNGTYYTLVRAETAAPEIAPTAAALSAANFPPITFDAQACDPEQSPDGGCSWDLAAWPADSVFGGKGTAQLIVIAGVDISWSDGGQSFAADPNSRCELVIMDAGLELQNVNLVDARAVIFTVSTADYDGWRNVLAAQEMATQARRYECPGKSAVTLWTLDNGQPVATTLQLRDTNEIKIADFANAQPLAAPAAATSTEPGANRRLTADNPDGSNTLTFAAGDSVVAFKVTLADGTVYSQCAIVDAPQGGIILDGVFDPFQGELDAAPRCN